MDEEELTWPLDRPTDLIGKTYKVPVQIGEDVKTMYVNVSGIGGRALEVFTVVGKTGSDLSIMADCISRLISCWLQHGAEVGQVLKHLLNMRGTGSIMWPAEKTFVLSVPDGIGKALMRWVRQEAESRSEKSKQTQV